MRKLLLLVPLIAAVIVAGIALRGTSASAEDVILRTLDASTHGAVIRVGNYTWIEESGIGIQLPPAPPTDSFPRLLAGRVQDEARSAALYELGPEGFKALQSRLEAEGASFEGSEPWPFRPRRYPDELPARRTRIALSQGRGGMVVDWTAQGRHFAVAAYDTSQGAAGRRVDELLREVVQVKGVEPDGIAPLLFQGRYVCVLNGGWRIDGERMRRRLGRGWISLRVFQVADTDFERVERLQAELEARLTDAGFPRSAGRKPMILGAEGFEGEYFGKDGFLQRIAYGKIEGGYMVALMQAPEALRATLTDEMDQFVSSLQASGLTTSFGPVPLYFTHVQSIRCLAWQDGRRVLWGVLFDDGRRQPVLWRQDGIPWSIRMSAGSETIFERAGEVNSSRVLNPLVDAEARALELPEGFKGEVDLSLRINDKHTTTRLTIR